ncbi:MAG TPA: hypothetical protein VMH86_12920 [Rhizomicrobium sp.]|nr:hypothetical protein [Rhizomicrobium sp.]
MALFGSPKLWISTILAALALVLLVPAGCGLMSAGGWPNNHLSAPALADGVIDASDWNHWERGGAKLTAKLRQRFPIGSPVPDMFVALQTEGFLTAHQANCGNPDAHDGTTAAECQNQGRVLGEMTATNGELIYRWGGMPCVESVMVDWEADKSHRLRAIRGRYGAACL